jgi:putative transcriptional regulator
MSKKTYLTNHLLIAMPTMNDPNFAHSVLYVCEHNENGALGIIINRPTKIILSDILEQMEIKVTNSIVNHIPILFLITEWRLKTQD